MPVDTDAFFAVVELARSAVERDGNLLSRLVAGRLDGFGHERQRLLVGAEVGCETALVTDTGCVSGLLQQLLQRVEGFGAGAKRLGECVEADRHHHELLDFETAVGVGSAVDDVHQWRREHARLDATEVAPKREAHRIGRRPRSSHRHPQDRVGADLRLRRRPVVVEHGLVHGALIERIDADDLRSELLDDVANRVEHALA